MKNSFKKNNETSLKSEVTSSEPERIAKAIARSGLCSRREAERWILDGKVKVNNKILIECGTKVTSGDIIEVNGQPLPNKTITKLWLYHKQRGYLVTNNDPECRLTIFDQLKKKTDTRFISVGRLDMDSEGLLLLTNDGELARRLELPSTGWLRQYRVRVHGRIDANSLKRLADGVTIEGIHFRPAQAELERQVGANAWVNITLREGKNREVRRLMEHLGYTVT